MNPFLGVLCSLTVFLFLGCLGSALRTVFEYAGLIPGIIACAGVLKASFSIARRMDETEGRS